MAIEDSAATDETQETRLQRIRREHRELDTVQFRERLESRFAEMTDLLCQKREAYGPANLVQFGGVGIAIRASDKVSRLATMYRNSQVEAADGDTLDDTWRDLCGYGILGLMHEKGEL